MSKLRSEAGRQIGREGGVLAVYIANMHLFQLLNQHQRLAGDLVESLMWKTVSAYEEAAGFNTDEPLTAGLRQVLR